MFTIVHPQHAPTDKRLAVVCYEPTAHDFTANALFSGPHGDIVYGQLQSANLWRSNTLRLALRPDPRTLDTPTSTEYTQLLKDALKEFNPSCILLLGPEALSEAGVNFSIDDYRGSIFECNTVDSPFFGYKCIATYDPGYVFKCYEDSPLFRFDLKRAIVQSAFSEVRPPARNFEIHLSVEQTIERIRALTGTIALDIEGGIPPNYPGVTCISVATSPNDAFIIRLNQFSPEDQARVMGEFGLVLKSKFVTKILQNSLYDNFVLSWLWHCQINNVIWDTMLSGWEIYPELPKALGVQTSIWTEQPYYKFQRKIQDDETHYRYCCMDSCVTYEIALAHNKHFNLNLPKKSREHFNHNMQLLPAMLYMELKGIRYLRDEARAELASVEAELRKLQQRIDSSLGQPLNVNSPKQMTEALYRLKNYPPQYVKEQGRKTNKLTANVDALLELYRGTSDQFIHDILTYRKVDSARKQLSIECDPDGRMRSAYNLVGTDTGRVSSSESPTGNGFNLQTIMKSMRRLYVPDPGHIMIQCDLSGADGWTVAAHCLAQRDDTMMLDYNAKIKPAKVIAAMYIAQKEGRLGTLMRMNRDELKAYLGTIDFDGTYDWLYNAAKAVQHGSNYLMRGRTMSLNILKRGWKDANEIMYVSPTDCTALQTLYLDHRYIGVKMWQDSIINTVAQVRKLECASGHLRNFFGRPADQNTQRAACSHEPQANTTYATNLAAWNLWHDPENQSSRGPIIQPLHQVHDALLLQVPEDRLDWAKGKIHQYFSNPLVIAGQTLTIPFEGGYGSSWYDTKSPL